ncbi:hypothetical protein PRIPAC_96660 [Pristionchus pacificus]|uniref:Uncharacterized protein n=1 Tax=Pristionchus pacificus TaxID=54126 RepID=A0A454XY58_PRIPA|nr:hypothetical protein PRIPAC_96660 [Pristionchus pacificus]|eukprot:PDM84259.1 hypothetical protein PRIPAC_33282 [Pristionchus pacificus]
MRFVALIVASLIGLTAGKDGWVTQIQCNPPPCKPWATMKPMPPMPPMEPMKPLEPLPPMKPLPPLEPLPPMKPMEPFQWQWQSLNQAKGQK